MVLTGYDADEPRTAGRLKINLSAPPRLGVSASIFKLAPTRVEAQRS